jgi:hypothetical protein
MANDDFATLNLTSIYAGGSQERESPVQIGEAGMYPGYICTKRNTDNIGYLFNSSDYPTYVPCGILDLNAGHALDVAYTITTDRVEYFKIGQDTEVWMYCKADANATYYQDGMIIVASATDGYGMIFVYASTNAYTISPILAIGKVAQYKAGSTAYDKIVRVNLSI